MTNTHFLVISALGADRPGLVDELTRPIEQHGANIIDSRMTTLGGEFAILMLIEGGGDVISILEEALPKIQNASGLTILLKRTSDRPQQQPMLDYKVSLYTLDHPGLINRLASFFTARQINIHHLETDSYSAPHTGTMMFSAEMRIEIPANQKISLLRSAFFELCDDLNLDATFEAASL